MRPISIYTRFLLVIFANALIFITLPTPLVLAINVYFCSFQVIVGRVRKGQAWLLVCLVFALGASLAMVFPENLPGHYLLFLFVGVGRVLPLVLVAAFMMGTTKVSELVYLMRKIHAPQWLVIPVSVLFRFFPTVRHDYAQIRRAMKFRGIAVTTGDMICHPLRTMEYIYVPLLNNATNVATDLTSSALTRGIGDPGPKASIQRIAFTGLDAIMCALGLVLMGCGAYVAMFQA